ncbi:MAG TPA: PilZ domain-containing protein [Kofleriaceae bacterium]|nr:PilZ domain-containing protein [Kofleriaceae bacterium]
MTDRRRADTGSERRRHFRAQVAASAVVHASRLALRGRVVDLSLGGVRVRRADDEVPCPSFGTPAMIELELGKLGWVAQDGWIQRSTIDEIVIAFDRLAPQVEDLIEEEVLAAIEANRRPRMVVVDPAPERRQRVAAKLREAGCDSYEASTPLEAIDLVERPHNHITGIAVAEQLTQTGSDELMDFFAETNPGIRLAMIAEATGEHPRVTRDGVAVVAADDDALDRSLREFVDDARTGQIKTLKKP